MSLVSSPERVYYHGMFFGSRAWFQHTVIAVDTLGDIARKYGARLASVIEANPGIRPDVIFPGQKIQVPVGVKQGFWFLANHQ